VCRRAPVLAGDGKGSARSLQQRGLATDVMVELGVMVMGYRGSHEEENGSGVLVLCDSKGTACTCRGGRGVELVLEVAW